MQYVQVCGCCVPVGACSAELGMVALSRGTVLVSGSGVLLVGDVGTGLGTTRGFLCTTKTRIQTFYSICLLTGSSLWAHLIRPVHNTAPDVTLVMCLVVILIRVITKQSAFL